MKPTLKVARPNALRWFMRTATYRVDAIRDDGAAVVSSRPFISGRPSKFGQRLTLKVLQARKIKTLRRIACESAHAIVPGLLEAALARS